MIYTPQAVAKEESLHIADQADHWQINKEGSNCSDGVDFSMGLQATATGSMVEPLKPVTRVCVITLAARRCHKSRLFARTLKI